MLPSCLLWKEKSHKGGMGLNFQLVSKCMFLRNDYFVEMSAMASRDEARAKSTQIFISLTRSKCTVDRRL